MKLFIFVCLFEYLVIIMLNDCFHKNVVIISYFNRYIKLFICLEVHVIKIYLFKFEEQHF